MVLAISAIEKLRGNTSIIEGTGPRRRIVKLQPIYDALGENKVKAIGGCDSTGHIFETSKTSWWKFFFKLNDSVIRSLTALGKCPEPTKEVFEGCEELICRVLRVKKETFITAKELQWHVFCGREKEKRKLVMHYDNLVTDFDTDNKRTLI